LHLPTIPGVAALGPTTGGFGYEDARVALSQSVFDLRLRREYDAQKKNEQASALSVKDSRDVVVLAAGTAYLQAVASAARVEMAKAQLASARELDSQTAGRVKSEVSPEIDSLRAQVERQSAEQRVTNSENRLEKDRLTLARIIGLPDRQAFTVAGEMEYRPLPDMTKDNAIAQAMQSRSDLASAEAAAQASEATLRARKAERLPVISVSADYGGGGSSLANLSQVYSVAANVSVPLYTGGRIRADIGQAQSDVARKQAEYADLKGRVAYDVRVALLDVSASESSVKVAQQNQGLAAKALTQSQDRYTNGVTNYLEVVEAQEAVAGANENYIESLYSYNVSVVSLARAMGNADTRLQQLLGGK
jgi:outer membrane protein TolC